MTTYYKKLDAGFLPPTIDTNEIKDHLLFHYGYARYYKISNKDYLKSLSDSFKISPKRIYLSEGHGPLLPHIDNGQRSCINYYMHTGNYTTSFWIPRENAKRRKSSRYCANTNSYKEVELRYLHEDLILVDSFIAKDGEAYILNIEQIHSVEGKKPELPRSFIQFQWDFSMDELLEILNI
jgi:hypothetical protein